MRDSHLVCVFSVQPKHPLDSNFSLRETDWIAQKFLEELAGVSCCSDDTSTVAVPAEVPVLPAVHCCLPLCIITEISARIILGHPSVHLFACRYQVFVFGVECVKDILCLFLFLLAFYFS